MTMKSILDRSFRYTPSTSTDIRETFRKAREQIEANKLEAVQKVSAIKPKLKARTA